MTKFSKKKNIMKQKKNIFFSLSFWKIINLEKKLRFLLIKFYSNCLFSFYDFFFKILYFYGYFFFSQYFLFADREKVNSNLLLNFFFKNYKFSSLDYTNFFFNYILEKNKKRKKNFSFFSKYNNNVFVAKNKKKIILLDSILYKNFNFFYYFKKFYKSDIFLFQNLAVTFFNMGFFIFMQKNIWRVLYVFFQTERGFSFFLTKTI